MAAPKALCKKEFSPKGSNCNILQPSLLLSARKNPGYLVYILFIQGDCTTQLQKVSICFYYISHYKDPIMNQPVFHGICNQKKVVLSYGAKQIVACFEPPNRTGFFRSFPDIFGITTTAELQERGALGGSVKNRLRFFPYLCFWSLGMAGKVRKRGQDPVTLVDEKLFLGDKCLKPPTW